VRYWLIPLSLVVALAGCGGEDAGTPPTGSSQAPVPVIGGTPAPASDGSPAAPSSSPTSSPGNPSPGSTSPGSTSPGGTATPRATLEVAPDGCGVIRSEVTGSVRNLTWSVQDADGFEVLGRNAQNETRYRYFQPGRYFVTLTAFLDGGYRPVSNTVSITC
jgi:hypothetical protein